MILSILIAILLLGLLIFLHEFGHFILAKKEGMKVEEFGFGFPPKIFGKKIGETIYSINWIPFGGFVKILGEQGNDEERRRPGSFSSKSLWSRTKVVLGGVIMFWIIAYVILVFSHVIGIPTAIDEEKDGEFLNTQVIILQVINNSPAAKSGLKVGDIVKKFMPPPSFEQKEVSRVQFSINKVGQLQELTKKYAGQEIILGIQRGTKIFEISVVPRESPPAGEGPLGITLARVTILKYPWYEAIWRGAVQVFNFTGVYLTALLKIFSDLLTTGKAIGAEPAGPAGIIYFTMQAFQIGINYFFSFLFSLSIALAVCNLLPIPALDGGKLLFLCIEKIKGSPVRPKTENIITNIAFFLLLGLMAFITIRFDIPRFF